ncbi:SUMF1/EgtB/PvdO family nonheme iron enzyme [Candidatus Uabimicrobium amorphum]|uniref:Sulfatase-modifying factor enzyme-like domain-containing protein n=1 Tax=Uabimicrobium amorphum TaxID=2596890 RepID=A0A5S9IQI6_UABAM|nr:SUMF1/EgtB/PvdO family nonheme iron enzyme [Candidatus Uabimicrobium amorphum]BBM86248.1 hypothetical protein UABAM_04634 [Candidatus Uabimicrobium amorphum]
MKVQLTLLQKHLGDFSYYLKSLNYNTTIDQLYSVQNLMIGFVSAGRESMEMQELVRYIAPVMCVSPTQLQEFPAHFAQFYRPLAPQERVTEKEKAKPVVSATEEEPSPLQKMRFAPLFVSFLLAISVIVFVVNYFSDTHIVPTKEIRGVVVNKYGRPITHVKVTFADNSVLSDASGAFSLPLATDVSKVELQFSHDNYQPIVKEFEPEENINNLGRIAMNSFVLSGVVRNQKYQPISSAQVTIDTGHRTMTNASGKYRIEFYTPQQEITARISHTEYQTLAQEIVVQDGVVLVSQLRKVPKQKIAIAVRDEQNRGVPNCEIEFAGQNVRSDTNGNAVIEYIPTAERTMQVRSANHLLWTQQITVGQTKVNVRLISIPVYVISGQIVDEKNTVVPRAWIECAQTRVQSDRQGKFTLKLQSRTRSTTLNITHPNYLSKNIEVALDQNRVNTGTISLSPRQFAIFTFLSNLSSSDYAVMKYPPFPLLWWIILITFVFIIGYVVLWKKRRYSYPLLMVQKHDSEEHLEIKNRRKLYATPIQMPGIQNLQQSRYIFSHKIDYEKTAVTTANNAGLFTPIYETRKQAPHYLALIDRTQSEDHHARWAEEMLSLLIAQGIQVKKVFFESDPRTCYDPYRDENLSLRQLLYQYPQHRLLIYSDGDGLIDEYTGQTHTWANTLQYWSVSTLFTPQQIVNWGYKEWLLMDLDITVLPGNQKGVDTFCEMIAGKKFRSVDLVDYSPKLPPILQQDPQQWLNEDTPTRKICKQLQQQLRRYLGDVGYYWLQACAVSPKINWQTTMYLGQTLQHGSHSVFSEERLNSLSLLPWMRYGTMPQWLRILLVKQLSPSQYAAVMNGLLTKGALGNLFLSHTDNITQIFHTLVNKKQQEFYTMLYNTLPRNLQNQHKYQKWITFVLCTLLFAFGGIYWRSLNLTKRKDVNLPLANVLNKYWKTDLALWQKCWNGDKGYWDFTIDEWVQLPHQRQVEVAQIYQKWYAQEKGLKLTKVLERSGVKFVLKMIPPGKFWRGSTEDKKDSKARHKVWISEVYWVGETEVTQEQWQAVMRVNPSDFKDVGLQGPVEKVSWYDCQEFCKKAEMRLLTEAEWEYACRAGTTRAYNLGDSVSSEKINCQGGEDRRKTTTAKSLANMNSWGCYDFHGNVCEWCGDWYGDYDVVEQKDPKGAIEGSLRVLRSGGWNDTASDCRSAKRYRLPPRSRYNILGLRLCISGLKDK